jgi:DNA-binding transcriptional MerR regulator
MKEHGIKKLYYSISEVSKITDLEQYVLRYWETEFEDLKPSKNRAGNRIYTNRDIEVIFKIKKLLRDKKYTIEGAKKILRTQPIESIMEPEDFSKKIQISEERLKKSEPEENPLKKDLEEIKSFLMSLQDKI